MKYKIRIEIEIEKPCEDGTLYKTWQTIYEQRAEHIDIKAVSEVVNKKRDLKLEAIDKLIED